MTNLQKLCVLIPIAITFAYLLKKSPGQELELSIIFFSSMLLMAGSRLKNLRT